MLPIAESMKEPEKFNNVLINGMITIGFLFISVGGLSFLAFGEKVETIVFLNLPKSPAVTALQFLYAIAIMLSFPLCVYPAIRITEQGKKSFNIRIIWTFHGKILQSCEMAKEFLSHCFDSCFRSCCLGWIHQS
jgi:amino acid permease